ncbi:tetratricopeptide repeat protein [Aerosakkonemataceae cyanobacterium BLCC-F50]|uniref:Tetratricopeptide repeat protein n=1 Tax=Floridaenema flaviceps BLCC-F50 TaxID=3153642 RepID=A0ABV4XW27_9CYAN
MSKIINSKLRKKIKRAGRILRNWLKRKLRRWLKPWLTPKKKTYQVPQTYAPPEEERPLDSADYEYFFMQLLEGVDHGWRKNQVERVLAALCDKTTEAEWINWLKIFGDRLLAAQISNEHLASQMIRLGELGGGTFGKISREIGFSLLARSPQADIYNHEFYREPEIVETPAQKAQDLFNQGVEQFNAGDFWAAITTYNKALEILPNANEIWYNRANALFKLGKATEAIASYEKALEFKADKYEAWNNRGNALFNLGYIQEALESYTKAVEIQPQYHQAWFNKAVLLGNLGRLDEAIASYDKALEIKPQDDQAWFNRGLVLGNLGQLEEAIVSWDKALTINPERYEAWYNRSVALNNLGRTEEANASLEKAKAIKPDLY